MALALEFHPDAQADYDEAVARYEGERRGLGVRFGLAVREATDRAAEAPLHGSPVSDNLRRVFVRRFPYAILYAVEAERVYVVAVAHFRRRPDYWRDRR